MKTSPCLCLLLVCMASCDEDNPYLYDTWTDPAMETPVDAGVDVGVDAGEDPSVPDGIADADADDPAEDEPVSTAVCDRYSSDMAGASDGTWTGSVSTCDPGDMSVEWRQAALRVTNLVRWMAGMPASTLNTSMNAALQQCALIMTANGRLSHSPTSDWTCYTSEGASAAGRSNLDLSPAVRAIGDYMNDWGNETTYGHRRWILSHGLDSVGFGSTNGHSCMLVSHAIGGSDPAWIGWPPPGQYPYQARFWLGSAWTIQSNTINLRDAVATVSVDGAPLDIETWNLLGGYGSGYAIAFSPRGSSYSVAAGQTYRIEVPAQSISYDVQIVDCE